jgi:hypothetical protein
VDLQGAHALLATEHKEDDLKPCLKWIVGILKDSAYKHGKTVSTTIPTLPMPFAAKLIDFLITAPRAFRAVGPSLFHQILLAGILIWKHGLMFFKSHCPIDHQKPPLIFTYILYNTEGGLCQVVDNRLKFDVFRAYWSFSTVTR